MGEVRELEFQAVLHELEVYQIELEMQVRELREAQLKIEESHDRYVNLYDFAPIGYLTLSESGVIQEINLTAAAMLGVERHWLTGRLFAPWVLPTDIRLFRTHLKECQQSGRARTSLQITRRDGHVTPIELTTSRTTDFATGEEQLRTTFVDLTERRKAEADLDRFFSLSNDLLCIISKEGNFLRVNPACDRLLGYTARELLGRSYLSFIHPDDRETARSELARLANQGATTSGFVTRHIRKDRSTVWLSWSKITSENALYCVARDVSDSIRSKRENENRYEWLKEMVRRLPIPLSLVEAGTGQLISMSGFSPKHLEEFPKSVAEMATSSAYCANAQGERLPIEEWPRMRAARGEELEQVPIVWINSKETAHLLASSRNIPAQYDQPAIAVLTFQDVTHIRKTEESLRKTADRLREERDLRERFVSALTHDLRTPLTAVRLAAQLLTTSSGDPKEKTRLSNTVIRGVDRIEHMVRDLLDANRIRAGKALPMERLPLDLALLARLTLEELTTIHGPRFTLDAPRSVIGHWSRDELQRVIENLVSNAIKYGDAKRTISVSVATPRESMATLSVHNFGDPIPKAEQATLFQQFCRAPIADRGRKKGWGIGLTLVLGIVEAHEGKIKIESNRASGTTFRIDLPTQPPRRA